MRYKNESNRHRQQYCGYQSDSVEGRLKGWGGQIDDDGDHLTLSSGLTMQYTGHVSSKYILETPMILLPKITPIHFINVKIYNLKNKNNWNGKNK